jgi:adenosylhomocysteine nucleosidase
MSRAFIIALPEETDYINTIKSDMIFYSGVGKINAAITACKIIELGYTEIINIGSCGSLKHSPGSVVKIGNVYQDIDIRPLREYGFTFNEQYKNIQIDDTNISCFTTDYFVDLDHKEKYSKEYLKMINDCDVFDMECFAIAKVCDVYKIKFRSYKWISDNGSGSDWKENCKIGLNSVLNLL